MTGKLLKYELRSMQKQFAIVWPALLLLGVVFGLVQRPQFITHSELGMAGTTIIILFGCVMIAMIVLMITFIINRFSSGLLKDEGYLMFTLPVTTHQLIISKLIAALIVSLVSSLVAFFSAMLLVVRGVDWGEFFSQLGQFFKMLGEIQPQWMLLLIEWIVVGLISAASSILLIYMCISIGHLVNKFQKGVSIVSFILISALTSNIVEGVTNVLDNSGFSTNIEHMLENGQSFAAMQQVMLIFLVFELVFAAVYYFATQAILSKKLNLE